MGNQSKDGASVVVSRAGTLVGFVLCGIAGAQPTALSNGIAPFSVSLTSRATSSFHCTGSSVRTESLSTAELADLRNQLWGFEELWNAEGMDAYDEL